MKIDYRSLLNEEQLKVVSHKEGPAVVIAGAGSGKTRVLTYRVAYLVENGVDPLRIMLVTFTNKAAREMEQRIKDIFGSNFNLKWCGTFHHIANMILRTSCHLLGYDRNFSIIDREDSLYLIKEVISNLDKEKKINPSLIQEIISLSKSYLEDMETILKKRYKELLAEFPRIEKIFHLYEKRKKEENVMDYDDLLYNLFFLLEDRKDFKDFWAEKFLHILVDEFQDTNVIQAKIVDHLGSFHRNIMVVGDDSQSIYSFRGASLDNILTFPEKYPDAKLYTLTINYRSTPEILNIANEAIKRNPKGFKKDLRPIKRRGEKPIVTAFFDAYKQAEFVGEKIERLLEEGVLPSEIAILYRAHSHSMEVQIELEKRRIPFELRSGIRFFEQAHIKDVTSFLRIITNHKDTAAWSRLLLMLKGIGKKSATEIAKKFSSLNNMEEISLAEKIFKGKKKEAIHEMLQIVFDALKLPVYEIEGIIRVFLERFYLEYMRSNYKGASSRIEDIEKIIQFSKRYPTLDAFLCELSLINGISKEESTGEDGDCKVVLSTVHQAKGLEWEYVFIIWLCEGKFPSAVALKEDPKNIEEERRLFYVAVTRAKKLLYLCYPKVSRGYNFFVQKPSRFIGELSKKLFLEVEEYTEY